MADPVDKVPEKPRVSSDDQKVIDSINTIAATKAGKIFFRWLAKRCFRDKSIIVGNVETGEVNTLGSFGQEFVRRLYQEIWRNIRPELRINIDYPNQNDE